MMVVDRSLIFTKKVSTKGFSNFMGYAYKESCSVFFEKDDNRHFGVTSIILNRILFAGMRECIIRFSKYERTGAME